MNPFDSSKWYETSIFVMISLFLDEVTNTTWIYRAQLHDNRSILLKLLTAIRDLGKIKYRAFQTRTPARLITYHLGIHNHT